MADNSTSSNVNVASTVDEADVFASALEIDDIHERKAFLVRMLGHDSEAMQRVERMLERGIKNDSFLEVSPAFSTTVLSELEHLESVGDWLGPYKLLQKIGEGGMGTVFMAEQLEPFKRRVAIKVIKPGMDSSQVLARFEAERQALAIMEHPNIARAIDVGTSDRGRVYFVMELVRGIPITRYCDEMKLDVRQRLELFIPVCSAIQHAHQKGIIHRDLKPSNVLVAEYDGQPVPKVIDFGVAKAVNQQLAQRTLFTQFGQIVGTMEYMSPEQSRINQLDIDTRSDVYSLGVLLYELITGTTPLESYKLREVGWDELTRMICEEDAPAPSHRLSTSETIADIANLRKSEPAKLSKVVRGELDWIILKALDKQRSRRYQSAAEFATDVRRYLTGEAVVACPPSQLYRLRKFCLKNRWSLVAGGLVAAALLFGMIGTTWQSYKAKEARIVAESQRDLANAEISRSYMAQAKALTEMQRSDRESKITRAVVDFVNNDLIAFADPNLEADRDMRLRTLVDRASSKVGALESVPEVEAAIRYTLGKTYHGLGEYKLALEHADRSWKIRRDQMGEAHVDTLASLLLAANIEFRRSQYQRSERLFNEALKIAHSYGEKHRALVEACRHGLGVSLERQGRMREAQDILASVIDQRKKLLGPNHQDTLDSQREYARLLFQRATYKEAIAAFESTVESMTEHLGSEHPLTLRTIEEKATLLLKIGRMKESRELRSQIHERQLSVLGASHPDSMLTAAKIAYTDAALHGWDRTIAALRKLEEESEKRNGADHAVTVQTRVLLAELLCEQGAAGEALALLQKSKVDLSKQVSETCPDLLSLDMRIAGCYAFLGRYEEAEAIYTSTLEKQRTILAASHSDIMDTEMAFATLFMAQGRYRQAEAMLASLVERAAKDGLLHSPTVILAECKLATLESVNGQASRSMSRFVRMTEFCEAEFGRTSPIYIETLIEHGEALARLGQASEAQTVLDVALEVAIEVYGSEHKVCARIRDGIAEQKAAMGKFEEAIGLYQQSLTTRRALLGELHPLTNRSIAKVGAVAMAAGDTLQGEAWLRKAYEESVRHFGPTSNITQSNMQVLASALGISGARDSRKYREALRLFEQLEESRSSLDELHPDRLSSKLSAAGLLAQYGSLHQAQMAYEELLPQLKKVVGPEHPSRLLCIENYAIVLAALGQYDEASRLMDEHLATSMTKFADRPATVKSLHAAIGYRIATARVLDAEPLLDKSYRIITERNFKADWILADAPFLIAVLRSSGESEVAQLWCKRLKSLAHDRLGAFHPMALLAELELLQMTIQHDGLEVAEVDISGLVVRLSSERGGYSEQGEDAKDTVASASEKLEKLIVSLDSLSEQWQLQGRWESAATLLARCSQLERYRSGLAVDAKKESEVRFADDYAQGAVACLAALGAEGKLKGYRELRWLEHGSEFDGLRERDDFQQVLRATKMRVTWEQELKLACSFAMAGDVTKAMELVEVVDTMRLDPAFAPVLHYQIARVWARCYETAKDASNDSVELARIKSNVESSLERCVAFGLLHSQLEQTAMDQDDHFFVVRYELFRDDRETAVEP